jgi:ubiquitin carboxyl-terminal hydrolase L3
MVSRTVQRVLTSVRRSAFPLSTQCVLDSLIHTAESDSSLDKLIKDAIPLKPIERADLLYESQALETAHQSAAAEGDTAAPSADDKVDLHYVCFVKSNDNRLWEMDGRRKGPLDRGELGADDDVLSEKALSLGVRQFMKREADAGGDLRFSLIVLAESLD